MKVNIEGIAPHIDGEYELDWTSLTNRELHQVKQVSGVRPAELLDAFASGDAAFACAVATIVCNRAGKQIIPDFFLNAVGGGIQFDFSSAEGDEEDPPTSVPPKRGTRRKSSGAGSRTT